MNFDDLTEAQRERVRACETPDEILAVAKEYGMELSADQLDAMAVGDSGGPWCSANDCNYFVL